jgi:ParB family chromosome partitioning protein
MTDRRLGRGLEYLITEGTKDGEEVSVIRLEAIKPNPYQPRVVHDEEAEKELSESIRIHGLLQPIVVRSADKGYEIVAGERRWRAAKRAGMIEIPCIRRKAGDEEMLALALVENLQRRDLNPIEKGKAFKDMADRLSITQEEVARRIGMSRAGVANFLRLLSLPEDIQQGVSRGTITFGHAKAILALGDAAEQQQLYRRIISVGLSVRDAEKEVKKHRKRTARKKSRYGAQFSELEERLGQKLGTRVHIQSSGKGGKIVIEFYSPDDFERIFELIRGDGDED